jgi:hypothetical protein
MVSFCLRPVSLIERCPDTVILPLLVIDFLIAHVQIWVMVLVYLYRGSCPLPNRSCSLRHSDNHLGPWPYILEQLMSLSKGPRFINHDVESEVPEVVRQSRRRQYPSSI